MINGPAWRERNLYREDGDYVKESPLDENESDNNTSLIQAQYSPITQQVYYQRDRENDFDMNKALPKIIWTTVISLAVMLIGWGGVSCAKTRYANHNRTEKLEYVLPDTDNTRSYLVNGAPATVTREKIKHFLYDTERIKISYGGVTFITSIKNDAKISSLEIMSSTGSNPDMPQTSEFIPGDKIVDYESWEKRYEELLDKIREAKFQFEYVSRINLEQRL
jgi:hypothetical protein